MNALTTTTLPVLSQSLQLLVAAPRASVYEAQNPDEKGLRINRPVPRPAAAHIDEARKALTGYISLQKPTPRAVSAWLFDLNGAVANPQSPDAFTIRQKSIGALLSEYPASVFTTATLHEAMRTFKFFPSAAELTEMLDGHLSAIRNTEAALRRVAGYEPEKAAAPQYPTSDEIANVARSLTAHRAEMVARRIPDPDQAPMPNVALTDEQLLARYDGMAAEGDDLAGLAAQKIRERLAAVPAAVLAAPVAEEAPGEWDAV